jgi:protein MpaA
MLRGTRGNARGVDLNRNWPTSNWSADPVFYKSRANDARDQALSPGVAPASEPETQALLSLTDRLKPRAIVSLHSALACVDDSGASHLGRQLADRCALPFLTEIGYPTPGSMGTWAGKRGLNLVTLELEDASLYTLKDRYVPILIDLMTGRLALDAHPHH